MHADSVKAPSDATSSITFVVYAGDAPGGHARLEAVVHAMAEGDARQVVGQIRQVVGVTKLEVRMAANPTERMRLCA